MSGGAHAWFRRLGAVLACLRCARLQTAVHTNSISAAVNSDAVQPAGYHQKPPTPAPAADATLHSTSALAQALSPSAPLAPSLGG